MYIHIMIKRCAVFGTKLCSHCPQQALQIETVRTDHKILHQYLVDSIVILPLREDIFRNTGNSAGNSIRRILVCDLLVCKMAVGVHPPPFLASPWRVASRHAPRKWQTQRLQYIYIYIYIYTYVRIYI